MTFNQKNLLKQSSLRQTKYLKTKLNILKTFIFLAKKNGYSATTITDICNKINISKRTFFNYFDSKSSMLLPEILIPDNIKALNIKKPLNLLLYIIAYSYENYQIYINSPQDDIKRHIIDIIKTDNNARQDFIPEFKLLKEKLKKMLMDFFPDLNDTQANRAIYICDMVITYAFRNENSLKHSNIFYQFLMSKIRLRQAFLKLEGQ